jgi:hypothetical protein
VCVLKTVNKYCVNNYKGVSNILFCEECVSRKFYSLNTFAQGTTAYVLAYSFVNGHIYAFEGPGSSAAVPIEECHSE